MQLTQYVQHVQPIMLNKTFKISPYTTQVMR